MFFRIKSYLKYILKSTNLHGIHSPFIYKFLDDCLYAKTDPKNIQLFSQFKKLLLSNKNTITVTDFGAGSKVFNSNKRAVNKIAKHAGIHFKQAAILINIANYFKPTTILEIGTSLGLGTTALHLGSPQSKIITLEGCPNTLKIAKNQFKKFDFTNIEPIVGEFSNTLKMLDDDLVFDLVYFDGNHKEKATLTYFEFCLKHKNNNSIFIFDDIHWSLEMENAWKSIKNHSEVTITIDLFQWGIVFFRKEQQKEHFVIRV